ncbi:ribokinase [Frigoribacterium faeni]|uniref:Ribokinase n=1 Tax=Frigoribacterium faeni TaxID=145483 RepID=A0A7W3JJ75_9MICO|nr:ribokinase [Frigoribacterium faeni]MBA8813766.1 ribokinase [Frigoribacterium faeni]BFF15070.1 ribokinase [Microbacterium flavescens]GEK84331.1 ribokinase [Frigoribacterium faeni]
MAPHTVHVVGSVNDDLRLTVVTHAAPGETITATSALRELGGKGANQAVAASRAGATVRFVGAVGTDPAGDELVAALAAEGIDTSGVARVDHELTGRAIVSVDSSGENLITVVPGANGAIDVDAVRASLQTVERGDIVVLQLEVPFAVNAAAARAGRDRGALVVLNSAPSDPRVLSLVDDLDLLVVNASELADLLAAEGAGDDVPDATDAGTDAPADVRAAAAALADRLGVRLLCTFGADGSTLVGEGTPIEQEAHRVEAVDTTAAGDTFIGYVAASLADDETWADALAIATRASAVAVGREGAARSVPTRAEVDALV